MQIKGKFNWLKHLDFMLVDLLSLQLSFVLSYWLKFGNLNFAANDAWTTLLYCISLLNILIAVLLSPYSGILRRSYYMETWRTLELAAINMVMTSVLLYLFKLGATFSREVFFRTYAIYFVLSWIFKCVWKQLLVHRKITIFTTKPISLMVVTDSANARKVLNNAGAGDFKLYDIQSVYLVDSSQEKAIDGIPVITEDLVDHILQKDIRDLLVAVSPNAISREDYVRLANNGVSVHISIESIVGFETEEQLITNVGVYKTLSIEKFTFTPRQMLYLGIKRVADILCALIGLVLLIPVTLGLKLACLVSGDTARIFYRQDRIGQYGKPIKMWKFRSMVPNADKVLDELLKEERYRQEWEEKQKFDDDPRITRIGRFIRRTSIDELPQLLNVLKGDMSLVGPRPLVKGELEAHGGLKLYQQVKPGITGWWGCNGRSNIDYRERLELEYYYVKNCSLYLDCLCLFRTVLSVLKRNGAQ